MATTPNGLPYPVGTDKVVDGDDAIRALAEAIDTKLLTGQRVYGGRFIGGTGPTGALNVTHGMGSAPIWATISLDVAGTGDTLAKITVCAIQGITATYIEARFVRTDTRDWLANNPVVFYMSWGMKQANS